MTEHGDSIADDSLDELLSLSIPHPSPLALRTAPFEDEEEYWELILSLFMTRHWIQETRERVVGRTIQHLGDFDESSEKIQLRRRHVADLFHALEKKRVEYEPVYLARLDLTKAVYPAPRIIRLRRALSLSMSEMDVLHYLILATAESRFAEQKAMNNDAGDIATFLGLKPAEFMRLFDDINPLILHRIMQLERDILGSPRKRDIKMDLPILKALRGLPLKPEDLFVLGDGAIRDILAEEPDFARLSATAGLTAMPHAHRGENLIDLPKEFDSADLDEDFSVGDMIRADSFEEAAPSGEDDGADDAVEAAEVAPTEAQAYETDLEYFADHIEWFMALLRWKKLLAEGEDGHMSLDSSKSYPAKVREAAARNKMQSRKVACRVEATRQRKGWMPRAERLAASRRLVEFEKNVLLLAVGLAGSLELKRIGGYRSSPDIGEILSLFHDTFEEQVRARHHFYREAPLVRDGLITISGNPFSRDILMMDIEIDRRMVDYFLGLDAEASSMVEGSHLYAPNVEIGRVVMPGPEKDLVMRTVQQYPAFQKQRRLTGLDELITYGGGIVLLFYGPSGTGKTMLANALASHMGKRILLINYPTIGTMSSDETLKYLFREAKIHDAILFFDECDGIFENRMMNSGVRLILSEIERHDGLVIMATNRPLELDEAMHRRITLAIEFRPPDPGQREHIWKAHIPETLKFDAPPDIAGLAFQYELTGGLIKNAIIAALAIATSRAPEAPLLKQSDLEEGARLQMRGRLRMADFEDRVVPQCGLSDLVLPVELKTAIHDLIGLEKARRTLVGQWGFAVEAERGMGTTAIFHGGPGTGKSFAAEAVAFELGRPIKRINAAQVVSKWVGEGAKNMQSVFRDARQNDAVLVFDEADSLFAGRTAVSTATDRYANLEVTILLREMERFPGVVILTSNLFENIDPAFRRRLRFILEFPHPDEQARVELWNRQLPKMLPVASDVNVVDLAASHLLTGAQIRNVILKAAARAALRAGDLRCVTQEDLMKAAADEERSNGGPRIVGFVRGSE